jgi:CheY-like chemotaxis protein
MEQSIKIMWIDDDLKGNKLRPYTDELGDNGFEVIRIKNPDEIEESIASNSDIRCIIVDVSMPTGKIINVSEAKKGMRTGLLILKRLHEDQRLKHIKKVIFTIVNDELVHQYCVSNNIKYLRKQECLPDSFLAEIKKVINGA